MSKRKMSHAMLKRLTSNIEACVFRVFPEGDVIAIFFNDVCDPSGNLNSYQRIGQHGGCSPDHINGLKAATSEERAALELELKRIGYTKLEAING